MNSKMKISANVCMSFIAIFFMNVSVSTAGVDGWEMLFNSEDFTGFKQLNGEANYTVEDGMMVGTTKLNTPNSFRPLKRLIAILFLKLICWLIPA